ncbi:MAG: hypothetical protein GXO02_04405 [Epsilonproteobacteria bacterium]|nr:hypothetical protein [Campylobacterota bacterium]
MKRIIFILIIALLGCSQKDKEIFKDLAKNHKNYESLVKSEDYSSVDDNNISSVAVVEYLNKKDKEEFILGVDEEATIKIDPNSCRLNGKKAISITTLEKFGYFPNWFKIYQLDFPKLSSKKLFLECKRED